MKVSIVTPSYNSGRYIEETITSIANQSYLNFEHIVVDGASSDCTIDILKSHHHLKWFSEPDKGQSDALNKGFAKATGDILAWQNADDLYTPSAFEVVVDFFQKHPEVGLVYGNYQLIDSVGNPICTVRPVAWNEWLFKHGRFCPVQPTVFWRRSVHEYIGELRTDLNFCMDVDFYARAARQFKIAKIDHLLGMFRVHEQSKTQNRDNCYRLKKEYKYVLTYHYNYSPLDSILLELFYYRAQLTSLISRNKLFNWLRSSLCFHEG